MPISILINDKEFSVYELSTKELRSWWDSMTAPGYKCDFVGEYAIPGISLTDLALLCRCNEKEFDPLTASQLFELAEVARKLNPPFFRLREFISQSSEKMLQILSDTYLEIAKAEFQ